MTTAENHIRNEMKMTRLTKDYPLLIGEFESNAEELSVPGKILKQFRKQMISKR